MVEQQSGHANGQPPTPKKMLTVVADNELAVATYPVDLAAPVRVHELSERVRSRRVPHASWWPGGVTMWAGLAPRKGFTGPAPSREDTPNPPYLSAFSAAGTSRRRWLAEPPARLARRLRRGQDCRARPGSRQRSRSRGADQKHQRRRETPRRNPSRRGVSHAARPGFCLVSSVSLQTTNSVSPTDSDPSLAAADLSLTNLCHLGSLQVEQRRRRTNRRWICGQKHRIRSALRRERDRTI